MVVLRLGLVLVDFMHMIDVVGDGILASEAFTHALRQTVCLHPSRQEKVPLQFRDSTPWAHEVFRAAARDILQQTKS